nr:STAS domain-containing protein [Fundidesulfovibrio soli]
MLQRVDAEGRVTLELAGGFSLGDSAELKQALSDALNASTGRLFLDMSQVDAASLTFFQLLFGLAAQARLDGKAVAISGGLHPACSGAAAEMGITQQDFDQAFAPGD